MSAKPFSMTFNVIAAGQFFNAEKAEWRRRRGCGAVFPTGLTGWAGFRAGLERNTDYWYGFANAPPRIARCARPRKSLKEVFTPRLQASV